MSLRTVALGFGGEATSLGIEIPFETGDCFVGKSKTPPRNDICTVEKFLLLYTFGPASTTSCGVPSVNLPKFWIKRIARSLYLLSYSF